MTLTLTPQQEAQLERSLDRGFYASQAEAVQAALNSIDPENPRSEAIRARLAAARKKNIVDLFSEAPPVDANIEFTRDAAPLREINFD